MELSNDKYESVEEAIDLYKTMIKVWGLHSPRSKYITPFYLKLSPTIINRVMISNFSAQIARSNEIILDLQDETQKEEFETAISKYMEGIEAFKKIRPKVPMSHKELKQHIKNALAHAEYDIYYTEDFSSTGICLYSDFVEGEISIQDMELLADYYKALVSTIDLDDEMFYGTGSLLTLRANNNMLLKDAISKIKKGKNVLGIKLPREMNLLCYINTESSSKPLTQEQQELIYNYIKYIGDQAWAKSSPEQKGAIFVRSIDPMLNQKYDFRHSTFYISTTLSRFLKMPIEKSVLDLLDFSAPTIYAGLILELGFLCLNYMKEAQRKQKLPNFDYCNVDLGNIEYWPETCVQVVSREEHQTKLQAEVANLSSKVSNWQEVILRNQSRIDGLSAADISEERKQQIASAPLERIKEAKLKLEELQAKITSTQELCNNTTGYTNSNDFFRHLRNSISHGFYRVDYSEALAKKDMSKVTYYFQDWDIDKDDRKNRQQVFEAKMTAGQLLNIFGQIEDRLVRNYCPQQDEIYFFQDIRDNKVDGERLAREISEDLQARQERHNAK